MIHIFAPSLVEMEAFAAEEYDRLPDAFKAMADTLVIRVEDFPDDETLEDMGCETALDLLGLYRGVSLDRKSVMDQPDGPDMVFLYRRAILDYWCETGEELRHLIRHVLIHEIGHHFGLSDEDIEEIEAEISATPPSVQ